LSVCETRSPLSAIAATAEIAGGRSGLSGALGGGGLCHDRASAREGPVHLGEWARGLVGGIAQARPAEDGSDYFDCWVAALSRLVTELSITSQDHLDQLTQSWHRAAEATPHGKPILLENDPER
jgi:hypothetical protein